QGVEPLAAPGRVLPALGEDALGVRPVEEVARPFAVVEGGGVLGVGHVGLAAVAELDLVARAAVGAVDEEHGGLLGTWRIEGRGQWATPAAPCSSMRWPVSKRSRLKGRLISCASSVAMVWARANPAPGVALNPPVPQPQLT